MMYEDRECEVDLMKHKLVFIGNSIVNGFPVSRGRSFPGIVRAELKEKGIASGSDRYYVDVINKGVNGETTMQILERFPRDVLEHAPAAVFIMTGTNDFIFREADPAGCMENLEKMACMAEEAGIVPVFMTPLAVDEEKARRMWMTGLGIDYEKINEEIEAFSAMIRQSGRLYLDSGAAWKKFTAGGPGQTAGQAEGQAGRSVCGAGQTEQGAGQPLQEQIGYPEHPGDAYMDGVHPTPEGYRFLAEVVIEWLSEHMGQLAQS